MAEQFRLSEASGQTCARMQRLLRIADRPALLRLAFAKGLMGLTPKSLEVVGDTKGPEIPLSVITRHDEHLCDALIVEKTQSPLDSKNRRRVYKQIIDVGFEIMGREFAQVGENSDYLFHLARSIGYTAAASD